MTTRHDGYESEPLFEAHPAQETVSNTPSAIQFTVEGTPPFAPRERVVSVGEELRIDVSALDVTPAADDIQVRWENGHVGPTYRVQPEDVGTTLRAVAIFASHDVEPLHVEVERASVIPAPAPSIDRSLISVAPSLTEADPDSSDASSVIEEALKEALGDHPAVHALSPQTFAAQELVPLLVAVDADAFSQPVDRVDIALVINGVIMQRVENIAPERLGSGKDGVYLLAEDGTDIDVYRAELTPPAGSEGSVAAIDVRGSSAGSEEGSARITVGVIGAGRTLALHTERGVTFKEPRVGRKSSVKVRLDDFTPQAEELSWQWLVDSRPVKGATTSRYKVRPKDRGRVISVAVLAQREGYLHTLVEVNLGVALPGDAMEYHGPDLDIDGAPVVGHTLSVSGFDPGFLDRRPSDIEIQWMRGQRIIPKAHGWDYTVTPQDQGQWLWARIIVKKRGYRATIISTSAVEIA